MKSTSEQILEACAHFETLLEHEQAGLRESTAAILELLTVLQEGSRDRRPTRLIALVRAMQDRLDSLTEIARRDFVERLRGMVAESAGEASNDRLGGVLAHLLDVPPLLQSCAAALLDGLLAATAAERGFVLFWVPESTEADIVAARNYQSTHLSMEEYKYSRTLLGDILMGRPLLLLDASTHPSYAGSDSVQAIHIRSVLAVPLQERERTVGAVYLENNLQPQAFHPADQALVTEAGRLFMAYLRHARLLPVIPPPATRVVLDAGRAPTEIIGQDPKILALHDLIGRLVDSPATVLIEGESGTGKELVARALHFQGGRSDSPFVAINCAAIPENLLESELFGHEKGAFTGATERYIGRVEQADRGTIFFDEIGDLSLPLQAKLLRFLQSGEFHRLGGRESRRVDVRVVAATSRDLKKLMADSRFLEALYYRLKVVPIQLPLLRERPDDIPLLLDHFRAKYAGIYGRSVSISPDVTDWLKGYSFPGNIRELENLVHRLVALSQDGHIRLADLPPDILQLASRRISVGGLSPMADVPRDLAEMRCRRAEAQRLLDAQERQLLEQAIADAGGNITEAARRLGLHRVTLHKLLRKSPSTNS
jgi:transcriptional regulator with GAF, ATPase, and Fis domain